MVSIVLPVRNAATTLERAVSSCLAQSYRDFELVLVQDASTDGTAELAGKLARRNPRVRLLHFDEHRGVAAAMEAGRRASGGEFVARMDADDEAHPERIASQVEYLEANPDIAACGSAVRIVGAPAADPGRGFGEHARWLGGLNSPEKLAAERFIDSPIANPSAMVRAAALEALGGCHDPQWAEDYDLWLRLLDAGYRLCNLPQVLLDWHDSGGRLTRSDPRYSAEMFSRAKAHYLARLPGVRDRGVEIAGAGPIGKRIARDLAAEGVRVHCFWEVNVRRIGESIGGVPVRGHDAFRKDGNTLLAAVGLPGARDRIRAIAAPAGYREGGDFFCVA